MMLSDYIEILKGRLEELGDIEVAMTQRGYYADGPLADLHSMPVIEEVTLNRYRDDQSTKEYLILGDSYQSY